ncbi:MAG: protein phosphatase CheZ [Proteobacteria bacterium]|nr:protein phosphatase CheZ [Pseudomonadota bacterium]
MSKKKSVEEQINKLEDSKEEFVSMVEVRGLIKSIKDLFEGNFEEVNLELYGELGDLAKYINNAKKELQDFQPHTLSEDRLPDASDQLAAIVTTTEEATKKIMDACDDMSNVHERVRERLLSIDPPLDPDVMASIDDALTEAGDSSIEIYEACTFQDLTGQRIQKIVGTLKEVERQVLRMIIVFGLNNENNKNIDENVKKGLENDAALLNGPQLPGQSLEQDSIDDILNQLL